MNVQNALRKHTRYWRERDIMFAKKGKKGKGEREQNEKGRAKPHVRI